MTPLCTIIVVTYNNPQLLRSCLVSMGLSIYGPQKSLLDILVVNNGPEENLDIIKDMAGWIRTVQADKNLGWEGGLKLGLANTDAPFIIFSNDDIRLISGQKDWFFKMMATFNDPAVGAVGPSSNFVMGHQNIMVDAPDNRLEVKYLIGFFMLLRRKALDEAGGVDDTMPGGDDLDLSIRLRDKGYRLVARRDMFVYHHGCATGSLVHGADWNSQEMQETTNNALIRKHGMKKFWETLFAGYSIPKPYYPFWWAETDVEGEECLKHVIGERVLELGCGGRKTVPHSVGMDFHERGAEIPFVTGGADRSVSDIIADASVELPVPRKSQETILARHLLEHCQDPLATLAAWNRALQHGGRLIIAVPHQGLGNTILMNPEHVVSFTPASLRNITKVCGFAELSCVENINGVSFVAAYAKVAEAPEWLEPAPTLTPLAARLEAVAA